MEGDEKLVDLLYREYARLSEQWNAYSIGAFDDFKYLAALGAVIVWLPLGGALKSPKGVLLLGFLAILFVVAVIGTRDFLKQSVCYFYGKQLRCYENALRRTLGHEDATFLVAAHWAKWHRKIHRRIGVSFYLLFSLIIFLFPSIVLWQILEDEGPLRYAYPIVAIVIAIFPLTAARALYRSKLARPCPEAPGAGMSLRCRACAYFGNQAGNMEP